jgi:peroxiredoxin Q/BCP
VLYFHPRDDTPGRTLHARDAQRFLPLFTDLGLQVVAVSVDTIESHKRFAAGCGLSFALLANESGEFSRRLDILTSDMRYPELGDFARRVTFIVKGDGTIAWMWAAGSRGHMEEVLEAARAIFRDTGTNEG